MTAARNIWGSLPGSIAPKIFANKYISFSMSQSFRVLAKDERVLALENLHVT